MKEENDHQSFVQKNSWRAQFEEHIDELLHGKN